jgi:hypothetical protein
MEISRQNGWIQPLAAKPLSQLSVPPCESIHISGLLQKAPVIQAEILQAGS